MRFTDLVCPISSERGNQDVARLTALFVALIAIAYLLTRIVWLPALLLGDFVARGAGARAWSPLARLAQFVVARTGRPMIAIDLAPKVFAARVGALFAFGIVATHAWSSVAALALAGVLTLFALLESVGNVCVGCIVYAHVMMPLVRSRRTS